MEGAHVGEEEINFKHMVVCKNEVIYGNIKKCTDLYYAIKCQNNIQLTLC